MIGYIDVEVQAANPQLPLYPIRAFVNSPSNVRVKNVPTEIGAWKITAVRIVAAYPDSSVKTVDCVAVGATWVATIAGCAVSGRSENGLTVFASGVDENGDAVSNYVLGKGNIEILKADGTLSPDAPSYYVHLYEDGPDEPNEGDMWPMDGVYVIYQDGEAHALGGGSSVTVDDELSTESENPVQNKVVTAALAEKLTRAEAEAGFTVWTVGGVPTGYSVDRMPYYSESNDRWELHLVYEPEGEGEGVVFSDNDPDSVGLSFTGQLNYASDVHITATRTRLPTMADLALKANASDVTAALALKADASSLPYALVDVTPTAGAPFVLAACFPIVYTPSGGSAVTIAATDADDLTITYNESDICYYVSYSGTSVFSVKPDGTFEVKDSIIDSITFNGTAPTASVTPVLGFTPTAQLTDRASSAISLTASATLAFPAQTTGKARDFVVRLTLTETNNVVPSVTFPADVAYETEGGEWPDLTEAGTYIVRLTEVPTASESETARFFLQCSSAVEDATPPSAGGGV